MMHRARTPCIAHAGNLRRCDAATGDKSRSHISCRTPETAPLSALRASLPQKPRYVLHRNAEGMSARVCSVHQG